MPTIVHHIRRREANIIRLQYASIVKFANEYFKLGTPMPSYDEMKDLFGFKRVKYQHNSEWFEHDLALIPRWQTSIHEISIPMLSSH